MHISGEFVAALIFGTAVLVVELATIWIVHWSTQILLEHRGKLSSSLSQPFTLD